MLIHLRVLTPIYLKVWGPSNNRGVSLGCDIDVSAEYIWGDNSGDIWGDNSGEPFLNQFSVREAIHAQMSHFGGSYDKNDKMEHHI